MIVGKFYLSIAGVLVLVSSDDFYSVIDSYSRFYRIFKFDDNYEGSCESEVSSSIGHLWFSIDLEGDTFIIGLIHYDVCE